MRRTALAAILAAPLLTACPAGMQGATEIEIEQARLQEQRAEQIIGELEGIEGRTLRQEQILAELKQLEPLLEAYRVAAEAARQEVVAGKAATAGGNAATGNVPAAGAGLLGLLALIAQWRGSKKTAQWANQRMADLLAEMNANLEIQGMAPTTARSAEKAHSAVALAAKRAKAEETAREVASAVAQPNASLEGVMAALANLPQPPSTPGS